VFFIIGVHKLISVGGRGLANVLGFAFCSGTTAGLATSAGFGVCFVLPVFFNGRHLFRLKKERLDTGPKTQLKISGLNKLLK